MKSYPLAGDGQPHANKLTRLVVDPKLQGVILWIPRTGWKWPSKPGW